MSKQIEVTDDVGRTWLFDQCPDDGVDKKSAYSLVVDPKDFARKVAELPLSVLAEVSKDVGSFGPMSGESIQSARDAGAECLGDIPDAYWNGMSLEALFEFEELCIDIGAEWLAVSIPYDPSGGNPITVENTSVVLRCAQEADAKEFSLLALYAAGCPMRMVRNLAHFGARKIKDIPDKYYTAPGADRGEDELLSALAALGITVELRFPSGAPRGGAREELRRMRDKALKKVPQRSRNLKRGIRRDGLPPQLAYRNLYADAGKSIWAQVRQLASDREEGGWIAVGEVGTRERKGLAKLQQEGYLKMRNDPDALGHVLVQIEKR